MVAGAEAATYEMVAGTEAATYKMVSGAEAVPPSGSAAAPAGPAPTPEQRGAGRAPPFSLCLKGHEQTAGARTQCGTFGLCTQTQTSQFVTSAGSILMSRQFK